MAAKRKVIITCAVTGSGAREILELKGGANVAF